MPLRTGQFLAADGCEFSYTLHLRPSRGAAGARYDVTGGTLVAQDGTSTPIAPRAVTGTDLAPDGLPGQQQLEQQLVLWIEEGEI